MKKRFLLEIDEPIFINSDSICAVKPEPNNGTTKMAIISIYTNGIRFDLPLCNTNIDTLEELGWNVKNDITYNIRNY